MDLKERNMPINWFTKRMLKEDYQAARSMSKLIERDFNTYIEYLSLKLSEQHILSTFEGSYT